MAEVGAELRWTADRESASEASWVCWSLSLGRQLVTSWASTFTIFAGLTVGLGWLEDHSIDVGAGVARAFAFSLLITGVVSALCYWKLVRSLRRELAAGTTLVARWDADSLTVTYPLVETRLTLDTFEAVRVFRFWVAIRQRGGRLWRILPRELVPADQLERLPVLPG